jgi:hypothetical protein
MVKFFSDIAMLLAAAPCVSGTTMAGAPPLIVNLPKAQGKIVSESLTRFFTCPLEDPWAQPFFAFAAAENKVVEESYDYTITEGGLARCLLADRLSADGRKVIVLEAGAPNYKSLFVCIPAGILRLFHRKYDWQLETGKEKACNRCNVFLQWGKVSWTLFYFSRTVHAANQSFYVDILGSSCAWIIGVL